MLFNSISYLLFIPVVITVLFLVPGKFQWLWLLACSTFFYYELQPEFLVVFFTLILLNYYFGLRIENTKNKRTLFNIALLTNLAILAFFKYDGIIDSVISSIFTHTGSNTFRRIILPIGLSYFIFTLLSYLIEIKRGTIAAEKQLGIFASALMFFPKILQGPIERPGKILHQFRGKKKFDYENLVAGLKLMLWGYFIKLVIADRIALYVNAVYGNSDHHTGTTFLLATFFYAIQIYADFTGYTNIALGTAKIMGFELTNNFKRPYMATSVKEFWNRWHISFSSWLRDYVFLPLAYFFSKKMKKEKYLGVQTEKWIFLVSSLITFAICGIWHGEGFHFLFWGLLFGIFLSCSNWTITLNKNFRKKFRISRKAPVYIGYNIFVTFMLVTFAFIFFRASSLAESFSIIHKILSLKGNLYTGPLTIFILSFAGAAVLLFNDITDEFWPSKFRVLESKNQGIRFLAYSSIIILIILIGVLDGGQFIYFQF